MSVALDREPRCKEKRFLLASDRSHLLTLTPITPMQGKKIFACIKQITSPCLDADQPAQGKKIFACIE